MPTTPNFGLPYPGLTAAPNVPADIQALAAALDTLDLSRAGATMGTPTTTGTNGTTSVATTETRDAVLGNYTFTAVAGVRYQARLDGMGAYGSVTADRFVINIRNGGASTPTAASPIIANAAKYIPAAATPGSDTISVAQTFSPGAGTVTLGVFVLRTSGTGTLIPIGWRELYAVNVGPA